MSDQPTDAVALRAELASGQTSVRAAVERALAAIAASDERLGAVHALDADGARARADLLDCSLASGEPPGALFGVPFLYKSNLCLADAETACGSRALAGWTAPYTATALERLLSAGAVPLGTTRMDEFGMGASGETCAFGPTQNPWAAGRTPGGSSSGSAAAVAAGYVPLALGTDTGGSVRQPAALCGISGLKPTYGRVSRFGLVAFGSSLDQIGPLARSARDLELALSVLSGGDPGDASCMPIAAFEPERLDAPDLSGLRVGVPVEWFPSDLDPGVEATVRAGLEALRELGAELHSVHLPHTGSAISVYYVIATAEASSNLARYDGCLYGRRESGDGTLGGMIAATRAAAFGTEVRRRIVLGTYVLSSGYYEAWYGRATRVRRLVAQDFQRAFETVDVIAGPTYPTVAFRLGERARDPVAMYNGDVLTVPASLAGLPAVSVPCGLARPADDETVELPVGLQLVGPPLADGRVLRAARALQARTDHHDLRPPAQSGAEPAGEPA